MYMAKHNDIGIDGEAMARRLLEEKNYLILETNWRAGHNEADIIAYKDGRIVFVEVKTRSSEDYGEPESFVDARKRKSYIRLANDYVLQKNRLEEVRFDIISIVVGNDGLKIKHIEDAFTTVV